MINNNHTKPSGITQNGLRLWGFVFLTLGVFSQCIIQNGWIGANSITNEELFAAMEQNSSLMYIVPLSLVGQAFGTCAVPIFSLMLVEGFMHTSDLKNYFLRVLGLAVLSEIPYNLAMEGKWFALESRNPVFGLILAMVVLYMFQKYSGKGWKNFAIKAVMLVAAIVWAAMLHVEWGEGTVLITAALWACRNKTTFRTIVGISTAALCTLFSMYYIAAPMGFLAIHAYNGQRGDQNRAVNYLAYPVILLAMGLSGLYM